MSTQEMPSFENGLGYMSCFKLLEYPDKVSVYIDNIFSEVFKDPWDNWDKIQRVFGTFGTYRNQENASFSKYPDQGDSQKGQYFLFPKDDEKIKIGDGLLIKEYSSPEDPE